MKNLITSIFILTAFAVRSTCAQEDASPKMIVPQLALAESPILGRYDFSDLKPTDGIQRGKGPEELGLAEPHNFPAKIP